MEDARNVLLGEPILPGNPWAVLGLWRALRVLLFVYLHPWKSQRFAQRQFRAAVLAKLGPIDFDSVPPEKRRWCGSDTEFELDEYGCITIWNSDTGERSIRVSLRELHALHEQAFRNAKRFPEATTREGWL